MTLLIAILIIHAHGLPWWLHAVAIVGYIGHVCLHWNRTESEQLRDIRRQLNGLAVTIAQALSDQPAAAPLNPQGPTPKTPDAEGTQAHE
jgi:Flp pilus assembly protein TadB